MRSIVFFMFLMTLAVGLRAQLPTGLIAYYPLDTAFNDATGNSANAGMPGVALSHACGAVDDAIRFTGPGSQAFITGPLNEDFNTTDFSISFYFKPVGLNGTQYLMSKRPLGCGQENAFSIRYRPGSNTLNVFVIEDDQRSVSLVQQLNPNICWYHVVVVRDGGRVRLFVNGELMRDQATLERIDLSNDGDLIIGGSECFGADETEFNGLMDDLRIYNQAITEEQVRLLYSSPDRIVSSDTVIFLGGLVDVQLGKTCATEFSWTPTTGVLTPFLGETIIQPPAPGTFFYKLQLTDPALGCTAEDSIRITVIDPASLDCSEAFLPSVFTPNGDGLNDEYGISNPYALQDFISLEIFDRWGGRVFATANPLEKWDGYFRGLALNPGIMRYRVRWVCQGEEKESHGSFMIMR